MARNLLKAVVLTAVLILPIATWGDRGPGPENRWGGPGFGAGGHGEGPPPWAGQGPGGPRFGHDPQRGLGQWWNHPEVREKLELTDEQVEALGKRRLEAETKMIDSSAKAKIAHLQLQDLIKRKGTPREEINKKVAEIAEHHKARIEVVVDQVLAMREILNEQQLDKVEKFMAQRKMRRGPEGPDRGRLHDRDRDRDRDPGKHWGKEGKERRQEGRGPEGQLPPRPGLGLVPRGPDGQGGFQAPMGPRPGEAGPPQMLPPLPTTPGFGENSLPLEAPPGGIEPPEADPVGQAGEAVLPDLDEALDSLMADFN